MPNISNGISTPLLITLPIMVIQSILTNEALEVPPIKKTKSSNGSKGKTDVMNKAMKKDLPETILESSLTFLFFFKGTRKPKPRPYITVLAKVAPKAETSIPPIIASNLTPCLKIMLEVTIVYGVPKNGVALEMKEIKKIIRYSLRSTF